MHLGNSSIKKTLGFRILLSLLFHQLWTSSSPVFLYHPIYLPYSGQATEIDSSVLKGKRVTGFSNTEEKLAMRSDNIPYTLEDRLIELGADYHKGAVPFLSHTEIDGLLITGQNPLSAGPTAEALINFLNN